MAAPVTCHLSIYFIENYYQNILIYIYIYIYIFVFIPYSAVAHGVMGEIQHIITRWRKILSIYKGCMVQELCIRKHYAEYHLTLFSCWYNCKYGCVSLYRLGCCLYIIVGAVCLIWISCDSLDFTCESLRFHVCCM